MNLVIKGHTTRGKEVIELLEMLGGNNPDNHTANCDYLGYFIGKETRNIYATHLPRFDSEKVIIYTIEEFLKKFPYKVGDKVSSKYLKNYKIEKMEWEDTNNRVIYKLQGMGWYNTSELQPYKEETMDKVNKAIFDANAQCCDIMNHLIKKEAVEERKYADLRLDVDQDDKLATEVTIDGDKITPPENYLIGKVTAVDNGLLVEFVKKQPQYPKTYEECCKVLFPNSIELGKVLTSGYNCELLKKLGELLICRDAYWKIAGEQMGLGEPWKPDWKELKVIKYTIQAQQGYTYTYYDCSRHHVLSFPTRKMRDAFYENFNVLIEICKELL